MKKMKNSILFNEIFVSITNISSKFEFDTSSNISKPLPAHWTIIDFNFFFAVRRQFTIIVFDYHFIYVHNYFKEPDYKKADYALFIQQKENKH